MIRAHNQQNPSPAIPGYRTCPSCRREKPVTSYYPRSFGEKRCIECAQKGYRPSEKAEIPNAAQLLLRQGKKHCPKCKQVRDVSEFYANGSTPDKLHTYCKPCSKAYARRAYKQRKDETNDAINRRAREG